MTRINCVPAPFLTDQHLLAEHREITRLPGNLYKSLNRKGIPFSKAEIPPEYVLGTGHVKFFMDKFKWLERRFNELTEECEKRGFNVTHKDSSIFKDVPAEYYGDWTVSDDDIRVNFERLFEKVLHKPGFYRYYGEKILDKDCGYCHAETRDLCICEEK